MKSDFHNTGQWISIRGDFWVTSEEELLIITRIEKVISKEWTPTSTVRQPGYKWRRFKTTVMFPKSGPPKKIAPRARRVIVNEVPMEPRRYSDELKAQWLTLMFMSPPSGDEHGRAVRRTSLFS